MRWLQRIRDCQRRLFRKYSFLECRDSTERRQDQEISETDVSLNFSAALPLTKCFRLLLKCWKLFLLVNLCSHKFARSPVSITRLKSSVIHFWLGKVNFNLFAKLKLQSCDGNLQLKIFYFHSDSSRCVSQQQKVTIKTFITYWTGVYIETNVTGANLIFYL